MITQNVKLEKMPFAALLLGLLCLLLPLGAYAQQNTQNKLAVKDQVTLRLYLPEKKNAPMRQLPNALLQAWCQGRLTAFYPRALDQPIAYEAMLRHFGYATVQPASSVDPGGGETQDCAEGSCATLDPWLQHCLSLDLEITETVGFDATRSENVRRVKYIHLIYSAECTANGLEYEGPVFRYDEVVALVDALRLPNPRNDAFPFTVAQYVGGHFFDGTVIDAESRKIDVEANTAYWDYFEQRPMEEIWEY